MANIWARKSIDQLKKEAGASESGFKRTLGPLNLINLGIGAIIGTGIFVLTGQVAADNAGPGLVISFIISGLACAFAGLCYAEFASMIPIAGSAYTYSYATLGELFAWIIGWDLIIEYLFAASTVAVGWSGYVVAFLTNFLKIPLPPELIASTGTKLIKVPPIPGGRIIEGWAPISDGLLKTITEAGLTPDKLPHATSLFNLPAVLIIAVITLLLIWGVQESTRFNNVVVVIKMTVVLAFIGFGVFYINRANWTPFIPPNTGNFGEFGWSGVLRGAGVIFFAYIGFDAVSTAAQEAKNPQRDLPIGILGSLVVCTVLYIAVALVLTGVMKYTSFKGIAHPVAFAVESIPQLKWLAPFVELGAIAGLSSVMLVMLMGQPRIFYTMANDGLLPPFFAKMHPKFGTPYVASIITGVVAMVLAGTVPLSILGELVSIGTLLAFTLVCGAVIVLRRTEPNLPRPFKTPLVPLIPILGILTCGAQMLGLGLDTWIRLFVWLGLGFLIYFLYGIKRSKVQERLTAKES